MKITGSTIQMAAAATSTWYRNGAGGRQLAEKTTSSGRSDTYRKFEDEAMNEGTGFGDSAFAGYTRNGALKSDEVGASRSGRSSGTMASLRNSLLSTVLMRFSLAGMFGGFGTTTQLNSYEYEEMSFRAAGQVETEDGRSISFDMNIFMSREFAQYTQVSAPRLASALRDPLVVNLGAAVAGVLEQTFRFDLDADGKEEDVAMLSPGSGFLALDKNGDGRINDGTELFGTQSGDGFGDLRAYDDDGNGWIDENDDVFSKLRVWYKNGDGEEELVDLKEADIGAIYLGEQTADFHLTGFDNSINGVIRSTGVFLRESGGMGTIQHVDLAAGEAGAGINTPADTGYIGGENFLSGYGRGDVQLAPRALVVETGRKTADSGDKAEQNDEASDKTDEETAAERAKRREELRDEANRRRAERRQRNEEALERARKRREDQEARIEKLFEERAEKHEQLEDEYIERVTEKIV